MAVGQLAAGEGEHAQAVGGQRVHLARGRRRRPAATGSPAASTAAEQRSSTFSTAPFRYTTRLPSPASCSVAMYW